MFVIGLHTMWWLPCGMVALFHLSLTAPQHEDGLLDYFESVVSSTKAEPKKVIGWVMKELVGSLNQQSLQVSQR